MFISRKQKGFIVYKNRHQRTHILKFRWQRNVYSFKNKTRKIFIIIIFFRNPWRKSSILDRLLKGGIDRTGFLQVILFLRRGPNPSGLFEFTLTVGGSLHNYQITHTFYVSFHFLLPIIGNCNSFLLIITLVISYFVFVSWETRRFVFHIGWSL